MTWQQRVRNLKRDVVAIALAIRDPDGHALLLLGR